MNRTPSRVLFLLVGLFLVATGTSLAHGIEAAASSDDPFDHFINEVRRFHYDYEPALRPAELALESDLVVQGRITGAQPGQRYAPLPGERPRIATTVLAVEITEVLVTTTREFVRGDIVYIELPHPAFLGTLAPGSRAGFDNERIILSPYDTARFAELVPQVDGIFFLDDRTHEPYWETILEPGAGRPAGAPLYTPVTQGFILQATDGTLVSGLEPLDSMPGDWPGLSSLTQIALSVRETAQE